MHHILAKNCPFCVLYFYLALCTPYFYAALRTFIQYLFLIFLKKNYYLLFCVIIGFFKKYYLSFWRILNGCEHYKISRNALIINDLENINHLLLQFRIWFFVIQKESLFCSLVVEIIAFSFKNANKKQKRDSF